MRVSTNTIFEQGIFNLQRNQAQLIKQQEQIATGRKVLTPADDPIAAARALEVSQAKAITEQYDRNGDSAIAAINLEEEALARYTTLLQDAKVLAVNAGNAALTPDDLRSLASELRGRYEELMGIANSTDGNGLYLFSGYQGTTRPFADTAPGVVAYSGDQGQRLIQMSATRQVPVSDAGSDVFQAIRTGNRTFTTGANASNTGTAVIDVGTVRDKAAWNAVGNPKNFEIRFHVDSAVTPAATTYDIVDTVNNVSLTTGAAPAAGPYLRTYQSGAAMTIARQTPPDTNPTAFNYGIDVSVSGDPATGDRFSIAPSASQDVFKTVHDLITALENTSATSTDRTRLANSLNAAQSNLDNALDVALTVRASVGARTKEIETNKDTAADLGLQYKTTLSNLQDLNYEQALSELSFQQIALEAAQKTFVNVQGLSLFNYL